MRLNDIALTEQVTGERILPTAYPADPQPVECPECGGSGRSRISVRGNLADINCPHCHGQGVREADEPAKVQCERCRGTGRVDVYNCGDCDASGEVEP